jgi:pimeloyl-ACP methyl ester carboxylesterase
VAAHKDFTIVERGAGPPVVLVPGVQGRWEYSRATVEALAPFHRVITFSLGDERPRNGSGSTPIDVLAAQVERAMDRKGLDGAPVIGVSFGALVALRFAATRPARTPALVMISAPGPRWHLRPRHDLYARLPWLFGPVFLAESPFRLRAEILAAVTDRRARRAFALRQLRTVLTAPVSLARMAARARFIASYDRVGDCQHVTMPTLIVHGEPELDHVTGDGGTAEYAQLIAGARCVPLERTGHLGSVTRADDCASIVHAFLNDANRNRTHRGHSAA